jgi:hypothetical protein
LVRGDRDVSFVVSGHNAVTKDAQLGATLMHTTGWRNLTTILDL